MKLPDKDILRPDEVALYFQVSVRQVYAWCNEGAIVYLKCGGSVRIERQAVVDMIRASVRNNDTVIGLSAKRLSNLNRKSVMQIL